MNKMPKVPNVIKLKTIYPYLVNDQRECQADPSWDERCLLFTITNGLNKTNKSGFLHYFANVGPAQFSGALS